MLTIFHGSKYIIEKPEFGLGKAYNDYGLGFYCTENVELAKEWACASETDGYANKYELSTDGLKILYLNGEPYHILNWLAILLENRTFSISGGISQRAKDYILENFLPDYKEYDVIIGYRADDSYFAYAGDFIDNSLSLENLKEAMRLGKLGEQIVIKSQKAFESIKFVGAIDAPCSIYYKKYMDRDTTARTDYQGIRKSALSENETYVMDIIRGQWKNNDSRI